MSDVLIPIQVIIKLFVMANGLFGYWVEGNSLTDPVGESFIQSMAVVVTKTVEFIAVLWNIF